MFFDPKPGAVSMLPPVMIHIFSWLVKCVVCFMSVIRTGKQIPNVSDDDIP